MFLVVYGHLIESALNRGGLVRDLYILIYLFHMPLFVGVSGYLARQTFQFRKVFIGVIVPYIFAELAYRIFDYFLIGKFPSIFEPYWLLWFLVSLACWRLLLPIWMRLPFPLGIAVVASLVAGAFGEIGYPLSLSRTIYFFPFFVLGHQLSGRKLEDLNYRWWAVAALFTGVIAVTFIPDFYSMRWTYGSVGYDTQGVAKLPGAFMRLGHYVAAVLLGFAVLGLVPGRESFLTVIGANTLPIFIGHGFIVLAIRELGYGNTPYILVSSAFLAVMICGCWNVLIKARRRPVS